MIFRPMRDAYGESSAEGYEMGKDRDRSMDAATAERLVSGTRGPRDVAAVLAAASAPGRPAELAGEARALAAFRVAQRGPAGARVRRPRRPAWARLAAVKIAAVGLAIAASGVALAAGTGVIPTPLHRGAAPAPGVASTNQPSPRGGGPVATPGATPSLPQVALIGLCHAYLAHVAAQPGKVWPDPNLATLVAAARPGTVQEYCTAITQSAGPGGSGAHPTGPPSPHPTSTRAHTPTTHPTH